MLLAGVFVGPIHAHRVSSVSLISYLDTEGRTYILDAAMEIVPSEDAAVNDQISPEDAAREFASYLNVMFDEAQQTPKMEISIVETSDAETPVELRRQQVLTKLTGTIPGGAKEFLLYLDPRCPMAVVMVVIKDDQPSRRMQVILSGEYSRPVSVLPVEAGDPFQAASEKAKAPAPAPGVTPEVRPIGAFTAGWRAFLHVSVLPSLLFIGTLLLILGRQSVFIQIAILLAGQGLVVGLASWSLIPVPGWSGTALAGLTAILTLEALFHRRLCWWRYPILAAAGLGLGCFLAGTSHFGSFAADTEKGLGRVILCLLGTEAAAVLVTLAAASILLSLSRFEWYRKSVVTPLAVIIAGYAIFAAVEVYL